ncbi:hypothetical protein V1512DRAFT_256082 [Lipomyces arxii]|uniref:uncharacterized protein n=1 Tax=Lipomyces arxii TaxID=56418 RepID=UPI0034CEFFBB
MSERVSKRKLKAAEFRAAAKSGTKVVKVPKEKMDDEAYAAVKAEKEAKRKAKKEKLMNEKEKETEKEKESQTVKENKKRKRESEDGEKAKKVNGDGRNRFILFVGNLPYSATSDSLREHLSASKPDVVRLPTDKVTKKVKGFAFAEFVGSDASKRMNVCLRLHHTELDGRKINVELTAGGGGSSGARMQKVREKNEKLADERRGIQEVALKKERTKAMSGGSSGDTGFVHPSRLAQVGE